MRQGKSWLSVICASSLLWTFAAQATHAVVIAQWTFETSIPATAGPHAAEVGSGSASGVHADGTVIYSNPVGNGSAESFSSDKWAIGDYYQFSASTAGNSGIVLEWDQASSNTGPRDFVLKYSTDGALYTTFGAQYTVLANAAPNPVWNGTTASALYHYVVDLSSITGLDNNALASFRLVDNSTVSANGGTVGTGGTDRVDNVTIRTVPEPATLLLLSLSALFLRGRKKA